MVFPFMQLLRLQLQQLQEVGSMAHTTLACSPQYRRASKGYVPLRIQAREPWYGGIQWRKLVAIPPQAQFCESFQHFHGASEQIFHGL